MSRIDLHAHVFPDSYRELLAAPGGGAAPIPPTSVDELLSTMDRYRIDGAVLSIGPTEPYLGDQGRADELARGANEALAELVADWPERFAALAVLPLPDPDAALAELAHALDHLQLEGVLLPTNTGGVYLGDPRWDPVFEELARRDVFCFVHPAAPPYALPLGDEQPVWLVEFPFETTRALAKLVFSGTLARHPRLRVQLAHLGGTVPFLAHRLESLREREPALTADAGAGVLEHLRRLYYDTGLAANAPALAATRAVAPTDRIVFGTDWPYGAFPADGDDPAPALGVLTAEERRAVDGGNAAALVPRLAEDVRRRTSELPTS